MTLKFRRIAEARRYLMDVGYRFAGYSQLRGNETYRAGGLLAIIIRDRRGLRVTIGA